MHHYYSYKSEIVQTTSGLKSDKQVFNTFIFVYLSPKCQICQKCYTNESQHLQNSIFTKLDNFMFYILILY